MLLTNTTRLGLISVLAVAGTTMAAVVYDSDAYVTSGTPSFVSTASTVTGTSLTRAFGTATPSSGYTGPAFSAGYSVSANQSVTGLGFNRQRVDLNAGASFGGRDFINIQAASTGGGNTIPANTTFSLAQVVFFESATPFAVSSFEVSALGSARSGAVAQTGRYLVRSGGNYYVSAQTMSLDNSVKSFTFNFGGDLTFAPYDPTASVNFDQASATFGTINLSSITGAGVYAENDSFTTPNSIQTNYTIGTFQLGRVSAVPEPASLALFGLSAVLGGMRRRR
jgi:hypothetical protein